MGGCLLSEMEALRRDLLCPIESEELWPCRLWTLPASTSFCVSAIEWACVYSVRQGHITLYFPPAPILQVQAFPLWDCSLVWLILHLAHFGSLTLSSACTPWCKTMAIVELWPFPIVRFLAQEKQNELKAEYVNYWRPGHCRKTNCLRRLKKMEVLFGWAPYVPWYRHRHAGSHFAQRKAFKAEVIPLIVHFFSDNDKKQVWTSLWEDYKHTFWPQ